MQALSCGMWDLVPRPGMAPGPPVLGAQSLSLLDHWESPVASLLKGELSGTCPRLPQWVTEIVGGLLDIGLTLTKLTLTLMDSRALWF